MYRLSKRRNVETSIRRNGGRIVVLWLPLVVLIAMSWRAAVHADDVADYLEQHGLKNLLAVHLEQQVEAAKSEERGDLVLRLASLYAELLDEASDAARRRDLEERSKRLLEKAPANSAEELRLALLRISYRAAEKTAENHRLRLATAAEIDAAKQSLNEIIPQLNTLRQRLKHEVESSDRRLARAAGNAAAAIGQVGEQVRNLAAQTMFLNAWALYYSSWLNQKGDQARDAEMLFASLLQTESTTPQPSDISVDLRSSESIARSILGMAMCKSVTASPATAIAWINLLDHENTFEALRTQAPAWKIAIHLEHREYEQVRAIVSAAQRGGGEQDGIPLTWLRLIAVHTLEDSQRSRLGEDLARFAVLEIASRGELQQILDLANRYGPESLGSSGFVLQYVHGLIKYQQAREAHGSDAPTLDLPLLTMYAAAQEQLSSALNQPDSSSWSRPATAGSVSPVVSCRRLIAWCQYFQSRFLDAKRAFEAVSNELSGSEAAESQWMAIVCLNKLVEAGNDPASQAQLAELTDRFLNLFPSHERAPMLRLRNAITNKEVIESAVEELLAISPGSEVYEAAQRRAADILYQLFRSARGDDRFYQANRFLSVAVPLVSDPGRLPNGDDVTAAESYLTRCRQILEVALADGVQQAHAAQAVFDALDQWREAGGAGVDWAAYSDEIDCRHVQAHLIRGDSQDAATAADELWSRDSASIWTRLATRAMFKHGHARWKNADSTDDEKSLGLDIVMKYGGRVLHEFTEQAGSSGAAIGYQAAVAEASMAMWERNGETDKAKAALYLYERLLVARPRNAAFLRAAALLAEGIGDRSKALDLWRRLASGAPADSELWYEAKYRLIKLLAMTDPPRAREVMDQHKQLNPDYGPEPWGGMLKGLDEQIPWGPAAAND